MNPSEEERLRQEVEELRRQIAREDLALNRHINHRRGIAFAGGALACMAILAVAIVLL